MRVFYWIIQEPRSTARFLQHLRLHHDQVSTFVSFAKLGVVFIFRAKGCVLELRVVYCVLWDEVIG